MRLDIIDGWHNAEIEVPPPYRQVLVLYTHKNMQRSHYAVLMRTETGEWISPDLVTMYENENGYLCSDKDSYITIERWTFIN